MAACQDHTAQEARQGRLHRGESLETDFTPRNAWKAAGVSRGGEDLACSRDVWAPPDQPLRSPQTTVGGTSAPTPLGTDLHRLARSKGSKLNQFRRERGLQRSLQGKASSADESTRHPRGPASMDKRLLLRAYSNDPSQRAFV